ncbi:MAG: extracellular solute-binding protein, partial [Clostridia bacterium]|nr:extracellular solute-binding protein [Clostridia bacterium]
EISGKWSVHEIPGFVGEDGAVNNAQVGGGTGAAILNKTKNPTGAWEFLKWWTSADTQAAYSQNVENVLGVAGRVTSANIEAVTRLSWQNDVLDTLLSSWEKVEELPELPGGYYVPRSIDMAFWNTYNKSESPKDLLLEWNEIANSEIERKIKQYEGR